MRLSAICAAVLVAAMLHAAPWENVPPLQRAVVMDPGAREIDYLREWTAPATTLVFSADETPVLAVLARIDTPGDSGCNFCLQILVNGRLLTDAPFHPRLLNKPLSFDPPGTDYHFQWYEGEKWMTIFSNSFGTNWGGSGHDAEFLFDLTGLVVSGKPATITFLDAAPCDIAAVSHLARTPLVIDKPTLGLLARSDADRLRRQAEGGDARVIPAAPDLPPDAKPGPRAYEVVWSGRPAPPSQVNFDDLHGWTVQARGDGALTLSASEEQLLWRPRVARFTYSGGTHPTSAEICPPQPILIPGPFDAVNLYLYGALNREGDAPVRVEAILEDADGNDCTVDLGGVSATYWGLQHGVLRPGPGTAPRFPMKFHGLALTNLRVKGDRRIYLDSMLFYQQHRKPMKAYRRPSDASFPTSDDGMLPTPPPGVKVEARRVGTGAEFLSRSPAGVLRFTITPRRGCLDGILARWGDGNAFRPARGGGIALAPTQGAPTVPEDAVLVESSLRNTTFEATWREKSGPAKWSATYTLRGRTLVVDLRCDDGLAAGVQAGRIAGLAHARAIDVPYLFLNGFTKIACGDSLFVSVLPDCYHSDFSLVDGNALADSDEGLSIITDTQYNPLTDGRRLPLRDRWLITVSPEFADTLPNTRNPVSPNRARLAPYMFFMADSLNPNLYRVMKRYGLDNVIATDFAALFVMDYAEGFSMRWRPHPQVGMEYAQSYVKGIKDLGYLVGLYGDFCDYFPYNETWDEDKVSLRSDGAFLDSWYGNYATKPPALPGLVRAVGTKCHDLYHPDCVYLDTHSCYGPVARDYEAGAAGAGIGWTTVLPNADAIVEARKQYGSTISEGLHRWLYAGITDMDYASLPTFAGSAKAPLLVDFDLLKIHPYNLGTMMGYSPSAFLTGEDTATLFADAGRGLGPPAFYKYLSASLAYGHMCMLGYSYVPPMARAIQYYATMQGVQREYLTDAVAEISYHNGAAFLSTSRALLDDTAKLGRLRIRYSRGLVVYVNYNEKSTWTVQSGGVTYDLPPYGWLIEKSGEILAFSALMNGARVDYVRCADYAYLNTGDATAVEGPLDVSGAAWAKREGTAWRVIPCGDLGGWQTFPTPGVPASRYHDFKLAGPPADRGCKRLVIDTQALMGKAAADVKVEARDDEGKPVDGAAKVLDGTHLLLPTTAQIADYVLR